MVEVGTGSLEQGADVFHDLSALGFDGVASQLARLGNQGDLARCEQQAVHDIALGVRADGCRGVGGRNGFH